MKRFFTIILSIVLLTSTVTVLADVNISGAEDTITEPDVAIKVPLTYTRDVFVTSDYVNHDSGYIGNMLLPGTAMVEDTLQKLSNFNNGVLTFNGVDYQFGPLGTLTAPSTLPNAVHSDDGSPIAINVPVGIYSTISFIANNAALTDNVATVTYTYTDGTTSIDPNITRIISFRTIISSALNTNESLVAKISAIKYAGSYPGNLMCYTGTVDQSKILRKITINSTNSVVYAMTAVSAKSSQISETLASVLSGLNADNTQQSDREIVLAVMNIISTLKQKGISEEVINNIEGMEKIVEIDKKLIRVTSDTVASDLDKVTIGVNFSGAVDQSSITKDNIKVYKNDKIYTRDYELVPVVTDGEINQIQVVLNNEMDYNSKFKVVISANVIGENGGYALNSDKVIEYVVEPPVEVSNFGFKDDSGKDIINIADVKGENLNFNFQLDNNSISDGQNYVILVAIYSPTGRMEARKIYSAKVSLGDNATINDYLEIPEYVTENWKVEATIWDSYQNCKKIFNTITK